MNEALTEAWLQELWPTCREVSREERAVDRARNAVDTPSNTRAKAQVNGYSGESKTAPGPVVGATGRDPGPNPRSESEAPVNHALPAAGCQQAAL